MKESPLYTLIKSLDKQEKRYFSLNESKNLIQGKNNYLKVFKAYDQISDPKEEGLIWESFKNEPFAKHLSVIKYQLSQLILKNMRAYHDGSTVDIKLYQALIDMNFLIGKKNILHYKKLLLSTKKLAYKYERYTILIELIQQEFSLIDPKNEVPRIGKLYAELEDIQLKIENSNRQLANFRKINFLCGLFGQSKSKSKQNQLIKEAHKLILKNCKSITAKKWYHAQVASLSIAIQKHETAYEHLSSLYQLGKQHKEIIKEDIPFYLSTLELLLFICPVVKKEKEIPTYLQEGRALIPKTLKEKVILFEFLFRWEFDQIIRNNAYQNSEFLVIAFEKEYTSLQEWLDKLPKLMLQWKVAYIYFILGNQKSALKWLNKILSNEHLHLRNELNVVARITEILIHFDRDNYDLVEAKITSLQKFLNKQGKPNLIENALTSLLKKLINTSNLNEYYNQLEEGLAEISSLTPENPKGLILHIDIAEWLKSKLEKRPMFA